MLLPELFYSEKFRVQSSVVTAGLQLTYSEIAFVYKINLTLEIVATTEDGNFFDQW